MASETWAASSDGGWYLVDAVGVVRRVAREEDERDHADAPHVDEVVERAPLEHLCEPPPRRCAHVLLCDGTTRAMMYDGGMGTEWGVGVGVGVGEWEWGWEWEWEREWEWE